MPVSRTTDGSTPRSPRIDAMRQYLYGFPLRMAVSPPLARNRSVYLCSYPKTGRTWLRYLLSSYIGELLELETEVDLTNMFTIIPNLSLRRSRGIASFALRGDKRVPMVLASHSPFDATMFADGVDVLFLLRGAHDVVVSSYFHSSRQRRETQRFRGSLADFIGDHYLGVARFARYHNVWAHRLGQVRAHVATYEKLHTESAASLHAILEFLGLPVDEVLLERARARAAFDQMQSLERNRGIKGQQYDRTDPESLRVRKGRVGGYTDYLDEEDISRITEACRAQLTPAARELFELHGLAI